MNPTTCKSCGLPIFHGPAGYAGPQCMCRWTNAAPRQPEGEGLKVVAIPVCSKDGDWYIDALSPSKMGSSDYLTEGDELCRISDAQRAIAERLDNAKYNALAQDKVILGLHAELSELREECERLRMQLAACGVVALANTPESASEARQMHQDYMSASCSDVAGAVDREMTLRQQLAELRDMLSGEVETNIPLRQKAFDLTEQRDKLAGLLREVRVIVAREVERWTRAAAILPVNANIESGLLTRIDATLADIGK